ERDEDIGEREADAELIVEKERERLVRQPDILQQPVYHAFAPEDQLPDEGAQAEARPKRHDDEQIEQAPMAAGDERQEEGERVTDEDGADRDDGGHEKRIPQHLHVKRVIEEFQIVVDIEAVDDGVVLDLPEAVKEDVRVRQQHEDEEIKERRSEAE